MDEVPVGVCRFSCLPGPQAIKKNKKNKKIKKIKKTQGPPRPHVCPDWGLRPDAAWRESGGSREESGSYEGLGLGG